MIMGAHTIDEICKNLAFVVACSIKLCHMKSACPAVLTLLLCVLFSCKKDSNPAPPDNRPLQLVKKVRRTEYNGQLTTDSIGYAYDTAGHLTLITDLKTNWPLQKYVYAGDTITSIITYGANSQIDNTVTKPVKYFDNGNTIFIDFTRPGNSGGMDTIQLTYKWSGVQLLEAWTYLNINNSQINLLQKTILTYNSSGNEYQNTLVPYIGTPTVQTTGVEYDQKKNFFSTLSRLNYIFIGWGFPDATRSVNNPTKGLTFNGQQQEYVWTYTKDDYPLTMQIKGKNYLSVELTYNK